jgi:hypothetical protein
MIMNKNYLKYAALMLLFTYMSPSFAMGGNVFKLTRFVGVGTLPAAGLLLTYKIDEIRQENHKELNPITDEPLQEWFKEQKEQLNIPNSESILLKKGKPWSAFADKKKGHVTISSDDAFVLNHALINQHKNIIARDSMTLKHELGHIVHKDSENRKYALAAIPIGVEALSFGITKGLRKLCNIQQQPKTFLKTTLRSCVTVGAIVPKALANVVAWISFCRYQETQADKFACEHAESRLELEEYIKDYKESENYLWASKSRLKVRLLDALQDPMHPAPVDRKEMGESYLVQWDREHAHEAERRV